jgi:hypothetical protein
MSFVCHKCSSTNIIDDIDYANQFKYKRCLMCGCRKIDDIIDNKILTKEILVVNTITDEEVELIENLVKIGKGIRAINKKTGIAKNTVAKYVEAYYARTGEHRKDNVGGFHEQKVHSNQYYKKTTEISEETCGSIVITNNNETEKCNAVVPTKTKKIKEYGAICNTKEIDDIPGIHLRSEPFPVGRAIKDYESYALWQYDEKPRGRHIYIGISVNEDGTKELSDWEEDPDLLEPREKEETQYEYWMFQGEIAQEIKRIIKGEK